MAYRSVGGFSYRYEPRIKKAVREATDGVPRMDRLSDGGMQYPRYERPLTQVEPPSPQDTVPQSQAPVTPSKPASPALYGATDGPAAASVPKPINGIPYPTLPPQPELKLSPEETKMSEDIAAGKFSPGGEYNKNIAPVGIIHGLTPTTAYFSKDDSSGGFGMPLPYRTPGGIAMLTAGTPYSPTALSEGIAASGAAYFQRQRDLRDAEAAQRAVMAQKALEGGLDVYQAAVTGQAGIGQADVSGKHHIAAATQAAKIAGELANQNPRNMESPTERAVRKYEAYQKYWSAIDDLTKKTMSPAAKQEIDNQFEVGWEGFLAQDGLLPGSRMVDAGDGTYVVIGHDAKTGQLRRIPVGSKKKSAPPPSKGKESPKDSLVQPPRG